MCVHVILKHECCANNCIKRCTSLLRVREIQMKMETIIRSCFILFGLAKIKKTHNASAVKNVGKWELLSTIVDCKK